MRPVFEALAVLAFVGVVLLMFAWSALLSSVRELQQARRLDRPTAGAAPIVRGLADPGGRATIALVVDAGCELCHERLGDFAAAAADLDPSAVRPVVVGADESVRSWASAGQRLPVIVDPTVWSDLAVPATPLLAAVEPDGELRWQRLVGSREELLGYLDQRSPRQQPVPVRPEPGGTP